jgi:hypothetical protein
MSETSWQEAEEKFSSACAVFRRIRRIAGVSRNREWATLRLNDERSETGARPDRSCPVGFVIDGRQRRSSQGTISPRHAVVLDRSSSREGGLRRQVVLPLLHGHAKRLHV